MKVKNSDRRSELLPKEKAMGFCSTKPNCLHTQPKAGASRLFPVNVPRPGIYASAKAVVIKPQIRERKNHPEDESVFKMILNASCLPVS